MNQYFKHSFVYVCVCVCASHFQGRDWCAGEVSVSKYTLHGLNVHVIYDKNCGGGLWGIMHNNPSNRVIIASFRLACVFSLKMTELGEEKGRGEEEKRWQGKWGRLRKWARRDMTCTAIRELDEELRLTLKNADLEGEKKYWRISKVGFCHFKVRGVKCVSPESVCILYIDTLKAHNTQ